MKTILFPVLTASAIALGGVAMAVPPSLPVRGTINAVNGSALSVTENAGAKISVTLAPNATITEVIPSSLSDVKPGTYVGTAAIKQPSGIYRALELQVFPETMRGAGMGTRPWNLAPHSTMTNGTVGGLAHAGGTVGTVSGSGDLTLTVNDGSGTKTVLIPSGVPVVSFTPGNTSDLRPGAHVMFFPTTAATSGSVTTSRIIVGENGLTPPM
ncbi:MAG TPA: hypothetical protein VEQ16_08705 [Acidocella sp.]|jgi:hypothetical protein|nr:hypothetical protein [Acidocella sp.]